MLDLVGEWNKFSVAGALDGREEVRETRRRAVNLMCQGPSPRVLGGPRRTERGMGSCGCRKTLCGHMGDAQETGV